MLLSITDNSFYRYASDGKCFTFTVNDTDFEEVIDAPTIWNACVSVYERRGLDVPRNIARLIMMSMSSSIAELTIKSYMGLCSDWVFGFDAKYRVQVEQYLQKFMALM